MRMLGDPAEAEEVTLEVYMQVWRSAASFDAKRGTVFTWLVMLTRSRAIDRLRSARTRRRAEEPIQETNEFPDPGHSPECATWISERRSKVQAAVNALPPDQRQAIELAFFDGLSHGELAERLGQPVGTVKTRIRLGMIKLRQALGPEAGL
jgi:RNA polymerase sigma-70 factor (ECF subfamily)